MTFCLLFMITAAFYFQNMMDESTSIADILMKDQKDMLFEARVPISSHDHFIDIFSLWILLVSVGKRLKSHGCKSGPNKDYRTQVRVQVWQDKGYGEPQSVQ